MAIKVKVYSTPACVYCELLKQYFKEHKIVFEEVDVSENQDAAEEMIKKSGQMGVPVIEIDGEVIVGFDKAKIARLLNIN